MKTIFALCAALIFLLCSQQADAYTGCPGNGPTNSHVAVEYIFHEGSGNTAFNTGTDGDAGNATLSNIVYDALHRLKSYTRGATPFNFQYNAIGNVTVNPEFGAGTYQYASAKPHAVTSANGKTYAYDANGNMTNRNGQVLIYDEENQLVEVRNTDGKIIRFGYSDGGARLWQQVTEGGTTRTTIWIGGIYELKDGKTLCHVFADGRRIATFQPQGALCAFIQRTPLLAASQKWLKLATTWPFSEGRTPLTVCLFPLFGILAASMWGRRRKVDIPSLSRNLSCFGFGLAHRRRISRLPLRTYPRWMQIISVLLIVALFVAVTPTEVQAQVCEPIFWYYHSDHLGSSNILTDRSGNVVKHYEYTAFGQDRSPAQQPCAFNVSHRYTGQIFDEATGLYYYNARYYDPELGRFVQADTIVPGPGNPQNLNRYSYVRNNPVKLVDPSGHFAWFAAIGAAIVAGAKAAAVSAVISGIVAGATGGDVLQAMGFGALGGFLGGFGGFFGPVWGIAGGIAGGAATAAISGGNIGLSALTGGLGAVAGLAAGGLGNFFDELGKFGISVSRNLPSLVGVPLGGIIRTIAGLGNVLVGAYQFDVGRIGAGLGQAGRGLLGAIGVEPLLGRWGIWPGMTGGLPLPEKLGEAVAGANTSGTEHAYDASRGMHGWHGSSNAAISSILGPVLVPLQWLAGFAHEFLDIGAIIAEIRAQGIVGWFFDSIGDLLANTVGMVSGLVVTPSAATGVGRRLGYLIPGLPDPNPRGAPGVGRRYESIFGR